MGLPMVKLKFPIECYFSKYHQGWAFAAKLASITKKKILYEELDDEQTNCSVDKFYLFRFHALEGPARCSNYDRSINTIETKNHESR